MADQQQIESSTFVRRLVIRNPKLTLEQLQAAWDKAGMPRDKRPKDMQIISSARYALKEKYGLKSADDLPIKGDGEPNVSELMRLLFARHPDMTEPQCRHYLTSDGLTFTTPLFNAVKKGLEEKKVGQAGVKPAASPAPSAATVQQPPKVEEKPTMSPDDNQHKGPRARFVGGKGRPPGKTKKEAPAKKKPNEEKAQKYLDIENMLDEVMQKARELEDSKLVEEVRGVRRTAIVAAIKLV